MDHFEEERTQQPVPSAQQAQPDEAAAVASAQEACADAGYYHGAGAGQREVLYDAPQETQPLQQPAYQSAKQPWDDYYASTQSAKYTPPAASAKPKKKHTFWKGLVAAVLILALVAGSCGVTVWLVDRAWQQQYDLLKQNFDEKLDVLKSQIDQVSNNGAPGGQLAEPGKTLTASEVYQQNVRSVVAITASIRTNSGSGYYESTSMGTGFVLQEDGYIVTNHHVIEGASAVRVTMYDGQSYAASLVGSDATNDIALLKINAVGLDPVVLGSSSAMQVGDQVVAIGNALGELSSSLTVGYISGIDRDVATDGSVITMLQTDAAINSGNSGGPLFNARGEVVGINTAKYSGTTTSGATIEGIGFAIPIDDVVGMLQDLMTYGYIRSAYLGIYCTEVDESAIYYGVPRGVYVEEAVDGFCAKAAGVRSGDIIIGLGGYEVESMNDLSKALRAYEAGQTVTITIWRSGREVLLNVTLDEKPQG